jgi:CheY-like chemotaxis protein
MKRRVLIFDDDKSILDIFTIILEDMGCEVFSSQTSHDIIVKVEGCNPDLIIMDNWIPNIGGIEATRLLKTNLNYNHIPVIYCSANSDIALLAESAGAEAYLSKPFDIVDLEKMVCEML